MESSKSKRLTRIETDFVREAGIIRKQEGAG